MKLDVYEIKKDDNWIGNVAIDQTEIKFLKEWCAKTNLVSTFLQEELSTVIEESTIGEVFIEYVVIEFQFVWISINKKNYHFSEDEVRKIEKSSIKYPAIYTDKDNNFVEINEITSIAGMAVNNGVPTDIVIDKHNKNLFGDIVTDKLNYRLDSIPFNLNLNQEVGIKITDMGYDVLANNYNAPFLDNPNIEKRDAQYFKDKADANGYTKLSLWEFMSMFGQNVSMGMPKLFDLTIIVYPLK